MRRQSKTLVVIMLLKNETPFVFCMIIQISFNLPNFLHGNNFIIFYMAWQSLLLFFAQQQEEETGATGSMGAK